MKVLLNVLSVAYFSAIIQILYFIVYETFISIIALTLIIIIIFPLRSFQHQQTSIVFRRSLSDIQPPQVFRTLLTIHADLNTAVVLIFSTCPATSLSFSPYTNPLVTVPIELITIGINVTFMFHRFFHFCCKVQVLIFLFDFCQFYSVVRWDSKVHNSKNSLFLLLIIIRYGRLA